MSLLTLSRKLLSGFSRAQLVEAQRLGWVKESNYDKYCGYLFYILTRAYREL